jgi:formylglycine-generating enzyme required for sulfatase activity
MMNDIDKGIEQAKVKNRLFVSFAAICVTLLVVGYLSWLFLIKGFVIEVLPDEAATTQKIVVTGGLGFVRGDAVYLFGSKGEIQVSAKKYIPQVISITEDSSNPIAVELRPMPAKVVIRTQLSLDDIEWRVNDKNVQQSQVLDIELPAGRHTIEARHPFYETALFSFDAEKAGNIQHELTLIPVNGSIAVTSIPTGARVYLDDQLMGTTPVSVEQTGGKHAVQVQLAGYQVIKDQITVSNNQRVPAREYNLIPLQASLTLNTRPKGGVLLVNGQPVTSPTQVDANTQHTISYEKSGYVAFNQSLKLEPEENKTISINLLPETASVHFTATETASVWINGQQLGQTPLTLTLQTVQTTVEFKKTGYRTVSQSFTPRVAKPLKVEAEMLTEFDARRREGKPLFADTLGIKMNKVRLSAYRMGSPKNEVGRSPNEHPVNVDFSRQIWISRHEITEAQFNRFTQGKVKSNLPASGMSWQQAAAFTNWLSENEGLPPFYILSGKQVVGVNKTSRGYRLPTEAEWEFIAKHNRRASPTKYIWGGFERVRDKQGNFADESLKGKQVFILKDYNDGFSGKAPVGSFKADRGGFFDLDGNVREWTHDFYSVIAPSATRVFVDYLGEARGQSHVVKGGSYKTGRMKELRTSIRTGSNKGADDIGFRIARFE